MSTSSLEREFHKEMLNLYDRIKNEAGYNPTIFASMLSKHGGVETVKRLIVRQEPTYGYEKLSLLDRLDLTVEAVVLHDPKWHPLFNEDLLKIAKKRLKDYGYKK